MSRRRICGGSVDNKNKNDQEELPATLLAADKLIKQVIKCEKEQSPEAFVAALLVHQEKEIGTKLDCLKQSLSSYGIPKLELERLLPTVSQVDKMKKLYLHNETSIKDASPAQLVKQFVEEETF
jgi:hypothetical protein